MMCASEAAHNGHSVTLYERNEKLGKKLFITGKGRCNLTNSADIKDFFENEVVRMILLIFEEYQRTLAFQKNTSYP